MTTEHPSILTHPFHVASQVRRLVHSDEKLTFATIAAWANLSPSGLTHAMQRPNAMNAHARRIAEAAPVSLEQLTGLPAEEAEKHLPSRNKKRRRSQPLVVTGGIRRVALAYGEKKARFRLDPRCEVHRMEGGRLLLLAPSRTKIGANDRVFVQLKDGGTMLRLYNVDANDPQNLVLLPETSGASPVVVRSATIADIRVIVGEIITR